MMKNIIIIGTLLTILLLAAGCSQTVPSQKRTATPSADTPEEVLAREVADGKLVEVYDDYVRVQTGKTKKNWMIINNVLDKDIEFRIYPCEGCTFDSDRVNVAAGKYKIVEFKVSADEGQKDIRVKDNYNNAYGYAQISVIVE